MKKGGAPLLLRVVLLVWVSSMLHVGKASGRGLSELDDAGVAWIKQNIVNICGVRWFYWMAWKIDLKSPGLHLAKWANIKQDHT